MFWQCQTVVYYYSKLPQQTQKRIKTMPIVIPDSMINLGLWYIAIGIISYNFVGPIFDRIGGYMPPGAFRTFIYGIAWPIPIIGLISVITIAAFEKLTQ